MRGWLGLALVACLVLSGCSGKAADPSGSTSDPAAKLGELEAQVSATTGAIKGVVVDAAIVPVPAAKVDLKVPTGGNKTMTADKEGRFVFSDLAPGTYFMTASAPLYHGAQVSADVKAGEATVVKVQIQPLYSQKPFVTPIKQKGFFECSQAGVQPPVVGYSSSNCITDMCPIFLDPKTCNGLPTAAMNNITNQNREWHMDVGAGWQQIVFEMQWSPTAQGTSAWMGMVVSTYKPERNPQHDFASVSAPSPMRFQLDLDKDGPGQQTPSGTPAHIPAEGMDRVSYFVSARRDGNSPTCVALCTPGLALNQEFEVFVTQFYYGVPPDGWSFVKGDPYPF